MCMMYDGCVVNAIHMSLYCNPCILAVLCVVLQAETSEAPMDTVSGTPMDVDGDSSSGDLECMVEKHAAFVGEMKQLKVGNQV